MTEPVMVRKKNMVEISNWKRFTLPLLLPPPPPHTPSPNQGLGWANLREIKMLAMSQSEDGKSVTELTNQSVIHKASDQVGISTEGPYFDVGEG
jgi:hypothetical protein